MSLITNSSQETKAFSLTLIKALDVTDLPEPDSPTSPTIWPLLTSISTPLTILISEFRRFWNQPLDF